MYKWKYNLKIADGFSFFQATPTNRTTDVLLKFCTKMNFLSPPTWILEVGPLVNVLALKRVMNTHILFFDIRLLN